MLRFDVALYSVVFGLNLMILIHFWIKKSVWENPFCVMVFFAAIYYPVFGWFHAAVNIYCAIGLLLLIYLNFFLAVRSTVEESSLPVVYMVMTLCLSFFICVAFGAAYLCKVKSSKAAFIYLLTEFDWCRFPALILQFAEAGFKQFSASLDNVGSGDPKLLQKAVQYFLSLVAYPLTVASFLSRNRKGK